MWGKVSEEEGDAREEELRDDFWKEMVAAGCKTERFERTHESAWRIIDRLAKKDSANVLLSREMVDDDRRLNETQAGVTLNKELEKLIRDQKDAVRKLEQHAKRAGNELVVQQLNERKAQIDQKINHVSNQLRALKIPFTRKVLLLFTKSKPKEKALPPVPLS
jgi:chromosome condensin MukBEF ATPase and DNA-binding subunit MukB